MPSKPTQDVWCELWEDAGSRGLDTWYFPSYSGVEAEVDLRSDGMGEDGGG